MGGDQRPSRKSKAFCRAVFENLHIAIGGDAKPCCEFADKIGNVKDSTIEEIWHSEALERLRAKMLCDERVDACQKCYEEEEAGSYSLRDMFNSRDSVVKPNQVDAQRLKTTLPKALDLRFSNLCNLSCRTCGPGASTKWYNDAKRLGRWKSLSKHLNETFTSIPAALKALGPTLNVVEQIYFAGGEPLLHEGHYAVINELIRLGRTDVRLTYNTNLTTLSLKEMRVLSCWSKFDHVNVGASIDGYEEQGELIREGLSWDKFRRNVRVIRQQCPHVQISFAITVSVFNILSVPKLCEHLRAIDPIAKFSFSLLQEPRFFSIQILPKDMKSEAKRRLESYASERELREELNPIINFMMFQNRSSELSQFRSNTIRLDSIRKQNTAEIIPELAPLLREPLSERCARIATQIWVRLNNVVRDRLFARSNNSVLP